MTNLPETALLTKQKLFSYYSLIIHIVLALQGFSKLGVMESGSMCEILVMLQGHRISQLLK